MDILYVGLKYDYGEPNRGLSFEHYNFYYPLRRAGHNIKYYDFGTLFRAKGRDWLNRRLVEIINSEKPDLTFFVLFENEFDQLVVRNISESGLTKTINWFCDDHWRFDNFSKNWASCFNWVVTTSSKAYQKYLRCGIKNVIKSQWGCNHLLYQNLHLDKIYDVTFIGQPHGFRRQIINAIRKEGWDVRVWGHGWESGKLSQNEMIRIINQSKINLNFSNSSVVANPQIKQLSKQFAGFFSYKAKQLITFTEAKTPLRIIQKLMIPQIKARNFEIPGTGGFLITDKAEDIESYYNIDEEIVCFTNIRDLINKISYYLRHVDERSAIADRGFLRTLSEHTYEHRFNEIFKVICFDDLGGQSHSSSKAVRNEPNYVE